MTLEVLDTQAPTASPGMDQTDLQEGFLPGLVIFVHGVNSDGEWYDQCEAGLVAGLNKRMGYDLAMRPDRVALRAAKYKDELFADGRMDKSLSAKNFITDPGRSPVIRFRWGYRAAGTDGTGTVDEFDEYAGKIYLNEYKAWGGGPFQNGTTALPYMWGDGLDDRLFWWVYANMLPVEGRDVYACPPRTYYAHAAHRLKELIKAIRARQTDCPITVVCHSQGNMVTLGAALLGVDDGALADTYILANPPYNLNSLGMDRMSNADSFNLEGDKGGVTDEARKQTFANFLAAVVERCRASQSLDEINEKQRNVGADGKDRFVLKPFPPASEIPFPYTPGQDRDNRGRVFLYCNPHDQVIGVSPVQGMGWQGVSSQQRAEVDGARRCFHVRVWAQPKRAESGVEDKTFKVGSADWTQYNFIRDNHSERFWNPPSPAVRYRLSLNERQGVISKVITALTSPLLIAATRLVNVRVNDDPARDWTVPINAPLLPEPIVPKSRRAANSKVDSAAGYEGREDFDFDEGKDPAANYLNPSSRFSTSYGTYDARGDTGSEAALRYEIDARITMEKRAGRMSKEGDDMVTKTRQFLDENPNATDHSTIVGNAMHAEKVVAYDIAIGWVNPSKINVEDLTRFRQFANWRLLENNALDTEKFDRYFKSGFFNGHQLQQTYTMEHMHNNAPKIIDQRKRGIAAVLRS